MTSLTLKALQSINLQIKLDNHRSKAQAHQQLRRNYFTGTTDDFSQINSTIKYVTSGSTHRTPPKSDDNIRKDAYGIVICKGSKLHKVSFIDGISCNAFAELIEYPVDKEKKTITKCHGCSDSIDCFLI